MTYGSTEMVCPTGTKIEMNKRFLKQDKVICLGIILKPNPIQINICKRSKDDAKTKQNTSSLSYNVSFKMIHAEVHSLVPVWECVGPWTFELLSQTLQNALNQQNHYFLNNLGPKMFIFCNFFHGPTNTNNTDVCEVFLVVQ